MPTNTDSIVGNTGDNTINLPKGRLKHGLDLVLGTDKGMRIRTSQFLLAALLMLASVGVLHFMQAVGIDGMSGIDAWTAFSCGGLVVIYGLIRSGFSLRLADPSMAYVQMLYAIACNAAALLP